MSSGLRLALGSGQVAYLLRSSQTSTSLEPTESRRDLPLRSMPASNQQMALLARQKRQQRAQQQGEEPTDPLELIRTAREGCMYVAEATDAMRSLLKSSVCFEVARLECRIATGSLEIPLRLHHWASALEALDGGAQAMYDEVLRDLEGGKTIAVIVEELRGMRDESGALSNGIAIVNAYRAAGQPSHPDAIEALAALIQFYGGKLDAMAKVENLLAGRSSEDPRVIGVEGPPVDPLSPDLLVSYRAALALIEGKSPTKNDNKKRKSSVPVARVPVTRPDPVKASKDTPGTSPDGTGSDGETGGSGALFRFPKESIDGFSAELMNARLAALLLVQHDIPYELAWWAATSNGQPPNAQKTMEETKEDYEASSVGGGHKSLTESRELRKARQTGWRGYRIVSNATKQRMTAKEILWAMDNLGYVELTLASNIGDHLDELRELGNSPDFAAWSQADARASSYQLQIDALEDKDQAYFEATGRHDPSLMRQIMQLKGQRNAERNYAADLRSGKTNVTAEMGKFAKRIDELGAQIQRYKSELQTAEATLRRHLSEQSAVQESSRYAGRPVPSVHNTEQDRRHIAELREVIADLEQESTSLEMRMGTGQQYPDYQVRTIDKQRKQRFGTDDGSYRFRTDWEARAMAVDASISSVSGRLNAALGTVVGVGGAAVSMVSGQPWFASAGAQVRERSYRVAANLDAYSAEQSQLASQVLGPMQTMVIQAVTEAALYAAIMAPVAGAGGFVGAAAGGSKIAATAGSMTALAASQMLLVSDKDAGTVAKAGALGAIMPIFGMLPVKSGTQVLLAFVGGAVADGTMQVDFTAGLTAAMRDGNPKTAFEAATRDVDVKSMFVSGLLDAFVTASSLAKPDKAGQRLLEVDGTRYELEGTQWVKTDKSPGADVSLVKVNAAEFDSVQSLSKAGKTADADNLIARASTRGDAIATSRAIEGDLSSEISELSQKKKLTTEEAERLVRLREQRATIDANIAVLQKAQNGEPISSALVEEVGGAPIGYVRIESGDFVPGQGAAHNQTGGFAHWFAQAQTAATAYRKSLSEIETLTAKIKAESAKSAPQAALLESLRTELAIKSQLARDQRLRFAELTSALRSDANTVQVDGKIGRVDSDNGVTTYKSSRGIVKVGDGDPSSSVGQVVRAIGNERYGGLARKKVKVAVSGEQQTRDGFVVESPNAKALAEVPATNQKQVLSFVRATGRALSDDVILFDSKKVGEVADLSKVKLTDKRALLTEVFSMSYPEFRDKGLANGGTVEQINAAWTKFKGEFKSRIDQTLATLNSKLPQDGTTKTSEGDLASRLELWQGQKQGPLPEDGMNLDMSRKTDRESLNGLSAREPGQHSYGTCATAAMLNSIRASKRGRESYILSIQGERNGEVSRHAITAVRRADGKGWDYLSYGKTASSWQAIADMAGYEPGSRKLLEVRRVDEYVDANVKSKVEFKSPADFPADRLQDIFARKPKNDQVLADPKALYEHYLKEANELRAKYPDELSTLTDAELVALLALPHKDQFPRSKRGNGTKAEDDEIWRALVESARQKLRAQSQSNGSAQQQ